MPPTHNPQDHFADRLHDRIAALGSPACVGLDPVLDKIPLAVRTANPDPVAAIAGFCEGVLRACAPVVPCVKFQSACFERHGAPGLAAMHRLIRTARASGLLVILDAKRGDIGLTAAHYAAAAFDPPPLPGAAADALTVSPYLGRDTLEPFLADDRRGVGLFVLVRTSNPGSDEVQSARLADGRTVAEMVGGMVAALGASHLGRRGLSSVGAVVGATKSSDAAALRRAMPDQIFLVPGYGAQGGTLDDIRPMLRDVRPSHDTPRHAANAGVLITASRSVIYAANPDDADWQSRVRDAATTFAADLHTLFR